VNYPPPGGPPPPPGNPYPPQGYPGQQPPWSPQQQWSPQQPPFDPSLPPKKRGNGWKWALGAVALLVIVGVTAAVTISVTKDDSGDGGPEPTGETFGLASANDKGPVNIITEDPSCAAWRPIDSRLADVMAKGWNQRDPAVPSKDWTPEQRAPYEQVGSVLRQLADQSVELAKLTPHRVMRELYEQFIAYSRAYSDAIPSYTQRDDPLAQTVIAVSDAIGYICTSIAWDSAAARAPLVPAPPVPRQVAILSDPSHPALLLTSPDPTCQDWDRILKQFETDTDAWAALDANVKASDWNSQQRAVIDAVAPIMTRFADDVEKTGQSSDNPLIQDFATISAQYRRAYVAALPTYAPKDSYLATASLKVASTVYGACKAAEA
jgi:hypothetical protein